MKKLVMALMLMPLMALADTWTDSKTRITWTYAVQRNGTVSIGGGRAAVARSTSGSLDVPTTIDGKLVTSIGADAFNACSGLTSVTIPSGVTSIGESAFLDCKGLTSVTIPSCVTSIEREAFRGCSGLTSVAIPSSVVSIGERAFEYCRGLTRVDISDLAAWCGITVGEPSANPLYYAEHLYLNGEEVKDLIIPEGVVGIGRYAFYNCRGLTSVTIPEGVASIGQYAFSRCCGLTSVTMPSSLTSIEEEAFGGCSGLTRVDISDLAAWCGITFGESFANPLYYAEHLYLNGEEVKDLIIPEGVMCIGDEAFYNCRGLTTVTVPEDVTSIGQYAFSRCSGLTSVTMPSSLTSIGDGAFFGCSNLLKITIPRGVSSIGRDVFDKCSNLVSINVDLKNLFYQSVNGALFTKGSSMLQLVCCPIGKSTVTIPDLKDGWLYIGENSFPGWPIKTIYVSKGQANRVKEYVAGEVWGKYDDTGVMYVEGSEPVESIVVIFFNANGGDATLKVIRKNKGEKYGELPEVSRAGYFFDGWFTAATGGSRVSASSTVNGDVTLYAHWIRNTGGEADVSCEILDEYRTKADVGVIPVEVVNVGEAVKIAVKGLPSGVKFAAKDVVDRKTKEVTVPANSIYGTPTKSGVYAATVTVKPTDGKSKMAPLVKTLTFVVRNADEHIVHVDCDAAQGSVKGMGVYASGKKVTLKATAAKGWVFAGWYNGEALVSSLASYALTMPDKDVNLTARFISVAEDKAAILLAVDGKSFSGGSGETPPPLDVEVRVGMYVEWPVAASALSATTVKVSGLPSGLKFTAKDMKATKTSEAVPANTIYGTPKTASKVDRSGKVTPSKVKITVTTAGKSKQEYILNVTVRGIPAEGTFNGGGENGLVTLTVAKTGKISGKYLADGKTWTLSAAGFDTWEDDDRMAATLTAKSGKEVKMVGLAYEDGRVCASLTSGGDAASPLFEAWRNEWKTGPQKSLATKLKGQKVTVDENGNIVLTVGASGAVTAKGVFVTGFDEKKQKDVTYSASCSTVLIPTEFEGRYVVYLYFPSKAGKFAGFTDIVEIGLGND